MAGRITKYNFAAALGLPKEFHREEPQAVYRHWRLREDQYLFLREKIPELRDASLVVRLWDEQHRLFFRDVHNRCLLANDLVASV